MSDKHERKCIVWDMDDTLCHFMLPVLQELDRIMGVKLVPEQLKTSMWLHDFLTQEQFDAFIPYVFNSSFYMELQPTAILQQRRTPEFSALHSTFDFHAVTARRLALGKRALHLTSDWLFLHANQVMDGITITHPDQPKSQVFPANTVAVVDDSVKVVLDAAQQLSRWAFLIDRPWNRDFNDDAHENIVRVTHENVLKHMVRILGVG